MPSNSTGICSAYYDGPNACPAGDPLMLFMSIISVLKPKFPQFCDGRKVKEAYDFVVVGGGSAGAIVAARLSEVEQWSVLLIEAGPEEPANALVPSMTASYLGTEIDWNYTTTGEKNACLSSGGSCNWPRGRNLGGNSVHNGMMYIRGNELDYLKWAVPGWEWKDVLPYYRRSENNKQFENEFHRTGGPLDVARFPYQPEIAEDIVEAGGLTPCGKSDDLNGRKITGFTVAQANNNNGVRLSSATAFLRPVRNRKNLHVLLNAQVSRVLFEDVRRPTAVTGVEYIKDGKKLKVKAGREVVLSAGTIGSPQILLLSGIGPAQDLAALKIKSVKDLPGVGKNLQNHVSYTIRYRIDAQNDDFLKSASEQYRDNQTGPMSSSGLSQVTGICPSNKSLIKNPDIQFYFRGYSGACYAKTTGQREIGIVPTYLHPKSRGTLKLASRDPLVHPLITQNYLSEKEDIDGVLAGIDMALRLFNAPPLKKYNPQHLNDPVEACKQYNMTTRAYWTCALQQHTDPENHQIGTCKMGADIMSVVGPTLKVHGIQRLRVADGAVMPKLISGNVAAPIMMIGERVADFIKMAHLKKRYLPQAKAMSNKNLYPYTPYLY